VSRSFPGRDSFKRQNQKYSADGTCGPANNNLLCDPASTVYDGACCSQYGWVCCIPAFLQTVTNVTSVVVPQHTAAMAASPANALPTPLPLTPQYLSLLLGPLLAMMAGVERSSEMLPVTPRAHSEVAALHMGMSIQDYI
jgi:hypothetical protein